MLERSQFERTAVEVRCPKCGRHKGEWEAGKSTYVCCGLRITIEEQRRNIV